MDAQSTGPPARVYVFQHVACEDLGTFAEVLAARGFVAEHVRLFVGDPIPEDWSDAAALMFLGGPMSVNDESSYPYLADEKAMIRSALARQTPTFGVCLGAQLIAAAAGSHIFPGVRPEVGWAPVSLTMEGRQDPVLAHLAELGAVFHWHGETFDLPHGAVRLAFSPLTMNQAFRLGLTCYGLQFHLEVDPTMIEAWLGAYPNDLGTDADLTARRITEDTGGHAAGLRAAAAKAMHSFLDVVERARGSCS
jgi:GMP synthase (glutamine-hydrolysing)